MNSKPTPTISREKNWGKAEYYEYSVPRDNNRPLSAGYERKIISREGNPDLEVGAVHKVRIRKDNTPPFRTYNSTVLEVHDTYYLELVETVPKTKTQEAKYRKICFPKVDHRFGIDSCNLESTDDDDLN